MLRLKKQTMKTFLKFYLAAICLSISGNLFSQNFISENKVWSIVTEGGMEQPWTRTTSYKFSGDTTIHQMQYKKLYISKDEQKKDWKLNSLWVENNDSVFQYSLASEENLLIYDFNISEKDSFLNLYTDNYLYVDSIRTREWGIGVRKLIYFHSKEQSNLHTIWINGVGQNGNITRSSEAGVTGGFNSILCFEENGELVYQNPQFNNCYINSEAPANTSSHDYQTVFSNKVALFDNSEKQIKALRIDSVKADADSVFYPFATIQEVSKNCFSPYKASWIGEKVVVKSDGTNLFFNREGDTITLKTRALINESWIAFQSADNFRVKATVQSIELVNFLGLTDSVKTITLSVIDQHENTLEHSLNSMELEISKTYGFVQTLNFYLFPDNTVRYPTDRLKPYALVGLTNPKVGIQNLTWFEVNDFQPGDELHILDESSSWEGWNAEYGYTITNKAKYKYLERIDYADSIVYLYSQKQSIETVTQDSSILEIFIDTLRSVVITNPSFDKLPGEPIIDDIDMFAYNLHMSNETILTKKDPKDFERFSFINDSCLGMWAADGCLKNKTYFKGLGGPYYECTNCCSLGGEERKLVYYKKGETEWGEKLVITGVTDIKTGDDLKVFPNPADNYITISNPSNIKIKKIELINFSGRIVQLWNATECAGNTLNIQHISPGVYLLKAETDAGIKTEKLVVH
jgi:hypothetical protein